MEIAYILYAVGGAVVGWAAKRFGFKLPAPSVTPSPTPTPVPAPSPTVPVVLPPGSDGALSDLLNLVIKNPTLLALVKMVVKWWSDKQLETEQATATALLAELDKWDKTPD